MSFDLEFWKQSEGQMVDATFPLGRCLLGGTHSAVFETQFQGRSAAIKIVPGTPESTRSLLASWAKSAPLSHPALVSIFAHGETTLADTPAAYLVMERTDDNLADLLAERPLTSTETREMLVPLLSALQYLHASGFAQGSLKPANIMASGEQLKISSDSLVPGGDPASDCLAIGTLLETVLGAGRNTLLPEPFAEIARHCSTPDPAARWNVDQIEACLRGERTPSPPSPSRATWWALAAAVVAVLAVYVLWSARTTPPEPAAQVPPPVPAATPDPSTPADASKPSAFKTPAGTRRTPAPEPVTPAGVTKVLPDIPGSARRTITGRVRVNVRVRVDNSGNVEKATLERPRASKYLSSRALTAAQSWKFPAGNAPQDWLVRFELTRQETLASAAKLGN